MNEFYITVSLDEAFDCYEMSKREVSKEALFYYDFVENKFVKIKNSMRNPGVMFINSYKLCSKLIDEYFEQPEIKQYKLSFEKETDGVRNKVVDFLWFFEHIDGCFDFQKYEMIRVGAELKKWCKSNNLEYLNPEIYCIH